MDEALLPKNKTRPSSSIFTPHDIITNEYDYDAIIPAPSPSPSYVNLIAILNNKKTGRSHSAPSVFTDVRELAFRDEKSTSSRSTPFIVRQAFIWLILYILAGFILSFLTSAGFKGTQTFKPVDVLYFIVVTLCTIGYGDIVPDTTSTKLFTCFFILISFGFIGILLNGLVTYICDRQESILLSTVDENRINTMFQTYMIDKSKGRMRIRIKVSLALVVVIGCIAIGTIGAHLLENLDWVNSFYLAVTSVTTVGYGDLAFETLSGRCFAVVWLLVSTLAVARAFLYLTELSIEKRDRKIAKWVLHRKMTLGDLVAADLDNDGSISKSEFVIYKLKEMGKIAEKDVLQICNQFDALDSNNCGRITVSHFIDSD